MHYNGIPVRDYASLSGLLKGGVISIATSEDPSDTLVQRFQITAGDRVSAQDLDDYLSPNSKYFEMFAPFMRQVSRLIAVNGITIAYETYVYQMDLDDWTENLESMGARRLPDQRRPLKVPLPMERILAESNEGKAPTTSQAESSPSNPARDEPLSGPKRHGRASRCLGPIKTAKSSYRFGPARLSWFRWQATSAAL